MKRLLSVALLAPLSACFSTPKFHDAPIRVDDRAHARVARAEVLRAEDGWVLEGNLRGAWLDAPSRRTVLVEARDQSGAVLTSERIVAHLADAPDGKRGLDRARFVVAVPAPDQTASYAVSVLE